MGTAWPTVHDDRLKILLAAGLSFSKIAAELNREFRAGYSRNAAIGRAVRMGLVRKRVQKPKRRVPLAAKAVPVRLHTPPPTSPDVTALRCVEVEPLHLNLLALQPEQCRWPYGDGPFTFCGHPVLLGSYCGPHHGLSVNAGTRSEQGAHRISRNVA